MMKIKFNDEEILSLSETQRKVFENDIPCEECSCDLKRRLKWVIEHKYQKCLDRLKKEWVPKLKSKGLKSIPLDDEEFAELVFAQEEYQNRSKRDEIARKEAERLEKERLKELEKSK